MSSERPKPIEYPRIINGIKVFGPYFDPEAPHPSGQSVGMCGSCHTVHLAKYSWK